MVTMDCDENPPLIHNSINRVKSESIEELTLPPSTTTIWRQLPISSYLRLPVNRFKKHKQTDSDSSDEDESSTTGVSTRVKIKTDVLRTYRKKNENEISLNRGEKITITGPPDRNGMVYGYKRTRLKLKKKKGLFPAEIVNGYSEFW